MTLAALYTRELRPTLLQRRRDYPRGTPTYIVLSRSWLRGRTRSRGENLRRHGQRFRPIEISPASASRRRIDGRAHCPVTHCDSVARVVGLHYLRLLPSPGGSYFSFQILCGKIGSAFAHSPSRYV